METSVEWLLSKIIIAGKVQETELTIDEIIEQAKEMHKQEIIDAYIKGREKHYLDYYPQKHSEEYYQETFKNDKL